MSLRKGLVEERKSGQKREEGLAGGEESRVERGSSHLALDRIES